MCYLLPHHHQLISLDKLPHSGILAHAVLAPSFDNSGYNVLALHASGALASYRRTSQDSAIAELNLRLPPMVDSMLSANAMPDQIKRAMEAGFLRYLTKPIKVDKLLDAIGAKPRNTAGAATGA